MGKAAGFAICESATLDFLDGIVIEEHFAADGALVAANAGHHDWFSPRGRAIVAANQLDLAAAAGRALLE